MGDGDWSHFANNLRHFSFFCPLPSCKHHAKKSTQAFVILSAGVDQAC